MKTDIIKEITDLLENGTKQIIFTGAPGTGKTYSVREYVKAEANGDEGRYKFVQFHPSYDYSDFVEGLRPVCLGKSNTPIFVRLDGTFKAFCRKIVEANLKYAFSLSNDEYDKLPGDDKKKKLDAIYNDIKKLNMNETSVAYKFSNGKEKYYFVIDEINRADLSKVFGELMFGLEESYRGIENRFDTQYKNLKTYEIEERGESKGKGKELEFDCFEDGFFIPHNLYLIGTMNDIDRSVESFDFALRRRFQWIDVKANDVMEKSLTSILIDNNVEVEAKKIEEVADKIIKMNEVISGKEFAYLGLSEAYHIGPAYFKGYDGTDNSLQRIFDQKIVSILREYTRGRKKDSVDDLLERCAYVLGVKYERNN